MGRYAMEYGQNEPVVKEDKEDRDKRLQKEFDETMPCNKCEIKDVCKRAFSIKRPDFDPEMFSVPVLCKKFDRFNTNIAAKPTKFSDNDEIKKFAEGFAKGFCSTDGE